jgi:hypothetical protein
MAIEPVPAPPICQVCDSFGGHVAGVPCCGSHRPPPQFRAQTINVVLAHYNPGLLSTTTEYGQFRLLNEDIRYELKAMRMAVRNWEITERHHHHHPAERLLPAGLVGLSQDSAFVHARVLGSFLRCYVSREEASARDFGVASLDRDYKAAHAGDPLADWLRAVNSRAQHLNQHRPAPIDRKMATQGPVVDPNVSQRVGDIADAIEWLWTEFRRALAQGHWAPLLDDIDDHARVDEDDTELRLRAILGRHFRP